MVDTTSDWILQRTGIHTRHIVDPGIATSDLGKEAAIQAIAQAGLTPDDIDLIIVGTTTPDMFFPSTAALIQHKIGAGHAWGFDLAGACSGFTFALTTASQLVSTGRHDHALVVGADVMSSIIDYKDRATCVLFGDGAGAALVSASDEARDGSGRPRGLISSVLRSDGGGAHLLERPVGGTRTPFDPGHFDRASTCIKMEGRPVYNFAVKAVAEGIPDLLAAGGFSVDDAAWIVPHQANVRIIEAAAKRAKIPLEKFYLNIDEYANTSAASIPIALAEMDAKRLLAPGDLVVTFGFGAGLTWGGNLLRW
jgi:3-oxoacyl-[acyl-carrier-protein] synthase-3